MTQPIDILKFCETIDPRTATPWTRGGFTYALKSFFCLRVPAVPEWPDREDAYSKPPDFFKDHSAARFWWPLAITHTETTCRECDPKCEECAGTGKVECEYGHDHECTDCGGTGVIKYEGACPDCGGSKVVRAYEPHITPQGWFGDKVLCLLDLLTGVEIGVMDEPSDMIVFRFDGGEGVAMRLVLASDKAQANERAAAVNALRAELFAKEGIAR